MQSCGPPGMEFETNAIDIFFKDRVSKFLAQVHGNLMRILFALKCNVSLLFSRGAVVA